MPRTARLNASGVFHHVMIRGIERRNIFRNKTDREDFLQRLGKLLPETRTACYGWVLLSNHARFLFRTGDVPLSDLARAFGISIPGISYSVGRGEALARANDFKLEGCLIS